MSLIGSLGTSFSSLKNIGSKMETVSSNINNADKVGYTAKTYETTYVTAAGVTTPQGGLTVGSISKNLYAETIKDQSQLQRDTLVADYLSRYSDSMGSVDGENSLSGQVDGLTASMDALAVSPSDTALKQQVVSDASQLAGTLNSLSATLQDYRTEVDQQIETTVNDINTLLDDLDSLNDKITTLAAKGQSTADLEDERMAKLDELAGLVGVQYFFNSNNELRIYTSDGQPLLDSDPRHLEYTASSSVSATTTFAPITSNGKDIAASLKGGELGGLLEVRDTYFVEEQEKLDALALALTDSLNAIYTSGTAYPADNSISGLTTGMSAATPLAATGTWRIATLDSDGIVQSVTDLDLSAYATVGDLVSALDGIAGVSAAIDADGALTLSADNSAQGVSLAAMDSDIGGMSASQYFGMNALFSATGAADIRVNAAVLSDASSLAVSILSDDAALAVGDRGITSGNATLAQSAATALGAKQSFSAAGNFATQNISISAYATRIVSNSASRASEAVASRDVTENLYRQTRDALDNKQGVNLDEETVRLTTLQAQYQSAATLISTIRDMFDDLVSAVR